MNDELRVAARDVCRAEDSRLSPGRQTVSMALWLQAVKLARAYLAERPADDRGPAGAENYAALRAAAERWRADRDRTDDASSPYYGWTPAGGTNRSEVRAFPDAALLADAYLASATRYAALRAALAAAMTDRQCAQRCDGPHADCPCWYCRGAAALALDERT